MSDVDVVTPPSQIEPTVDLAKPASIVLPKRGRGSQSFKAKEKYEREKQAFCAEIVRIRSLIDFDVSSRGWCYLLEQAGVLTKGDFDTAQKFINECRKDGSLPIEICAEDVRRSADNLEDPDDEDPQEEADQLVEGLRQSYKSYLPYSFWQDRLLIEMLVEKVDLRNLFSPVCERFHIPIANAVGWSDINMRAGMMRRFADRDPGKEVRLVVCRRL